MAEWLTYSNQGATRSQPISDKLVQAMSFLPELGVTMNVYSGGQSGIGEGGPRTGSTRHDHGNAADVMFYRDGRMLDWNNRDDIGTLSDIVSRARSAGVTGIGAGDDYMGPGRVHIGFGAPAVWGAGGSSANAPEWLRSAYFGAKTPTSAPALTAINNATTGMPTSGRPQRQQGLLGILGSVIPEFPRLPEQFSRQSIMNMVSPSLPTRTAAVRSLMNSNIGGAPTVSQGHNGSGSQAYAVTNGRAVPVTLSSGGNGRSHGSLDTNTHMNMDVYRANAAALGGGSWNQSDINRAQSSGTTLYRRA